MPVFHVLAIITRCSQTVEVLGRQELVLADLAQKPGTSLAGAKFGSHLSQHGIRLESL